MGGNFDSLESPKAYLENLTTMQNSQIVQEQLPNKRETDGNMSPSGFSQEVASLQKTFKVRSTIQPKFYLASKRTEQLKKPNTGLATKRATPFMHSEFRGLLHADFTNTIQQIYDNQRTFAGEKRQFSTKSLAAGNNKQRRGASIQALRRTQPIETSKNLKHETADNVEESRYEEREADEM